ncbi:MAG: BatA domain-containing protein [Gemmatimonadota bacterium]|nr:BatA domain-containing protein [Gemmatimonadota bacterium]
MTFLAPWGWGLAAAIAVPLVLHLWRRRAQARVEFPAVRYLLRMEREHAREVQVQNLLLMLLRCAIIVVLAAAIARPVARAPGIGHAPTAVAIVLDNSLSAQAAGPEGPVLARLAAAARGVVGAATAADRLWVVTMDGVVVGGDRPTLDAALAAVRPLDGAGDAGDAVRRAAALVRGSGLPSGRVVVLTDAQATSWGAIDPSALGGAAADLAVVTPGAIVNRAVTAVAAEPLHWDPRGAVRATVVAPDSASWRVVVDGRTLARGTALPGATILARAQLTGTGWQAGVVELAPDELRGDDRRHFAVHVGEPPAVQVASGAGPFLAGAVGALVAGGRARVGGGITVATMDQARRPGLLFAPSDPIRVADANRALERAGIPWRLGARRTGAAPLTGEGVAGAMAREWYALESATAAGDAAARRDTVATVGGAPWAVAGDGYVLVASPATDEATDLPVRAAFVPWIDRLVSQRLVDGSTGVSTAVPGAMVRVPAGVDGLELASGPVRPVAAEEAISAPWAAGVAFWRRGATRVGALVVNAEPSESDTGRVTVDTLATRLGARTVDAAPDGLGRAVFAAGGARSWSRALLILALLLLASEWLVAGRGFGRRTPVER